MLNDRRQKGLIFFGVGFLTIGWFSGTDIPQQNQYVQADHMEMLYFSDLQCSIHTPVSNTCLSREQLIEQ